MEIVNLALWKFLIKKKERGRLKNPRTQTLYQARNTDNVDLVNNRLDTVECVHSTMERGERKKINFFCRFYQKVDNLEY